MLMSCRYEFPAEEALFTTEDAFMLGPALLVAPIVEAGVTTRSVNFPHGSQWWVTSCLIPAA